VAFEWINSVNELTKLFENSKPIEIPKGKIIVFEGHEVNKVYLIKEGYVKVYTVVGANTQRILFIYRPNDVFPLTTILSGHKVARFYYETMTPTTLLHITPRQLEHKLLNNLPLAEEIIGYTSYLDRQFLERVNNMVSNKEAFSKLRSLLFFLCNRTGTNGNFVRLDLPLNSSVLASMSGITTKEAFRLLKLLKTEKVITQNDGFNIDIRKLLKSKVA
jgi:CRP-like cAMP-binding protein